MKVVFATSNEHKAREVSNLLPPKFSLLNLKDLNFFDEIKETGETLQENALIKARTIYNKFKLPVFADDTGLEVLSLNGAPGVYSARYAGENATFKDNCDKLLLELKNFIDRRASFRTVFCYIDSHDSEHFFEGEIHGNITLSPSGDSGFGYDPIFQPIGYEVTFAEMSLDQKNAISHRKLALQKLLDFMGR